MQFAKSLRARVQSGEITTSVRIWKQPRVKVGGRYRLTPGEIEVTESRALERSEISEAMARDSGFETIEALLKVAQHGSGTTAFLVSFVYRD